MGVCARTQCVNSKQKGGKSMAYSQDARNAVLVVLQYRSSFLRSLLIGSHRSCDLALAHT